MKRACMLAAVVVLVLAAAAAPASAGTRIVHVPGRSLSGGPGWLGTYPSSPAGLAAFSPELFPYPALAGPEAAAVTPDGRRLFTADYDGQGVSSFTVAADGTPSYVMSAPAPGACASSVVASADGRHVWTAGCGEYLYEFDVAADGTLAARAPVSLGAGATVTFLALHPSGRRLYATVIPAATTPAIRQFTVSPGGDIADAGADMLLDSDSDPQHIAVLPSGSAAYVSDPGPGATGKLWQFSSSAGGTLTPMPVPSLAPLAQLRGIGVSADGRHVYSADCATGQDAKIRTYDVGASGALSEAATMTLTGYESPSAMAAASNGDVFLSADDRSRASGPSPDDESVLLRLAPQPSGALAVTAHLDIAQEGVSWVPALQPDQPPVPAFSAAPDAAGSASTFDASATTSPQGDALSYHWDFGDGATEIASSPSVGHAYAHAGSYTVTLQAAGPAGILAAPLGTGAAWVAAASAPPASRRITVPAPPPGRPEVTALNVSASGRTVLARYRTRDAARALLRYYRLDGFRRGSCAVPYHGRCGIWKPAGRRTAPAANARERSASFRSPASPATIKAVANATDAAGRRGPPRRGYARLGLHGIESAGS